QPNQNYAINRQLSLDMNRTIQTNCRPICQNNHIKRATIQIDSTQPKATRLRITNDTRYNKIKVTIQARWFLTATMLCALYVPCGSIHCKTCIVTNQNPQCCLFIKQEPPIRKDTHITNQAINQFIAIPQLSLIHKGGSHV
ncbi:MAG: hypothetical protein D6706_00010, partial [Chloroflexi bacterium]